MSLAVVRDTALPSRPRRRLDVRQAVEGLRRRYPRAAGLPRLRDCGLIGAFNNRSRRRSYISDREVPAPSNV
jgi:hypothetical protein